MEKGDFHDTGYVCCLFVFSKNLAQLLIRILKIYSMFINLEIFVTILHKTFTLKALVHREGYTNSKYIGHLLSPICKQRAHFF